MTIAAGARTRTARWAVPAWVATRVPLLLMVFGVLRVPGPDVTSDVSAIYQGWYEVLRTGAFPMDDVAWQYPPAAALAVLSPGLLPFLEYPDAFFVLILLVDAVVLGLLLGAARRPGRRPAGAWVWIAGVPLLGPTAYARYDLMVTALAIAALLVAARSARAGGALAGFAALVKIWPLLLLVGTPRGRRTADGWFAAAVTATAVSAVFVAAMPGAFAFLEFQGGRGTEVESLGALVFHVARHFGWEGRVLLNYGSVEFLGPYVNVVSVAALLLTALSLAWIVVWRRRARCCSAATPADAAFTAVLLFTLTSRVISPQYMIWLVGLAAVCLSLRGTSQGRPAVLVLLATAVTTLEFPLNFAHVVASDWLGITLLGARNGLLIAAAVCACRALWRDTVRDAMPEPELLPAQRTPDSTLLTW